MMQSAKNDSPDAVNTQSVAADEQDLLRQAMSMFDMQLMPQVAMAFPTVITDSAEAVGRIRMLDVNDLFRQQELLLSGLDTASATAAPSEPDAVTAEPAPDESAELKAIQQMYAQS